MNSGCGTVDQKKDDSALAANSSTSAVTHTVRRGFALCKHPQSAKRAGHLVKLSKYFLNN